MDFEPRPGIGREALDLNGRTRRDVPADPLGLDAVDDVLILIDVRKEAMRLTTSERFAPAAFSA